MSAELALLRTLNPLSSHDGRQATVAWAIVKSDCVIRERGLALMRKPCRRWWLPALAGPVHAQVFEAGELETQLIELTTRLAARE